MSSRIIKVEHFVPSQQLWIVSGHVPHGDSEPFVDVCPVQALRAETREFDDEEGTIETHYDYVFYDNHFGGLTHLYDYETQVIQEIDDFTRKNPEKLQEVVVYVKERLVAKAKWIKERKDKQ